MANNNNAGSVLAMATITCPTGNATVAHATTAGALVALVVPGAGPNGAPVTYTVAVPTTAHKAGTPVMCKVGKLAKNWLGSNGAALCCTLVAVPAPSAGLPPAVVAFTHAPNGYVANVYPQGYAGCNVLLQTQQQLPVASDAAKVPPLPAPAPAAKGGK